MQDGIESWTIKPKVPIAHLLERLKAIMGKKPKHSWVLITDLEEEYFKEQGHSFEDDLGDRDKYHSLLDFLKYYPKHFVVHQVQEETSAVYVMLFQVSPPSATQDTSNTDAKQAGTQDSKDSNDRSELTQNSIPLEYTGDNKVAVFQEKLVKVLESLLTDSSLARSENYVTVTDFASAFLKAYKVPINQASLEATQQRCIKALSSSLFPKIKIKKQNKVWWVSLAQ